MTESVMEVGKSVLFAGLGVAVSTEQRAREVFDEMVNKGKAYENDDASLLSRATHEASEFGQRLEQQVQETVNATLKRAGVPSRDEIRQLTTRVEALTKKLDELAAK
jgi:polyhydroxyalkanoate synthesis regulator phasin